MKKLKVLFVGTGSIAKRHIHNLQAVAYNRDFSVKIDAFRHVHDNIRTDGIDKEYYNFSDVPTDYDVIFITNPTEIHFSSLKQFHDKGAHFFIEKPVVSISQIESAKQFHLRESSVYYVACPLRYNAVIQYIRKNINLEDIISVRSISSSYLPNWRPGQDYRNTYSAHKNMGGGVSIDLIHEWDYLTYLFGWPKKICQLTGKKSGLEIDSDDFAIYIAEYANKIVELHLDYFGRKTIREIELFTRTDTIIGDIANNQIKFLVNKKIINFHEERNDFQIRELEHFIDMVFGISDIENSYLHGLKVLALTQGRLQ